MEPGCNQGKGQVEQTRQGGQRSGDDEPCASGRQRFDARRMNLDRKIEPADSFPQELGFALVAFDQMKIRSSHDGQDQPGQTSAAAEVENSVGVFGEMMRKLDRIQDMASPRVR